MRGGNIADLEAKKYTIGVGISLGNKWFTPENIIEVAKWSLEHSTGKVVIYAADSIHAINLEVRNRISHEKALKQAERMSSELFEKVKVGLAGFDQNDISRLLFVNWDAIVDDNFNKKLEYLMDRYEKDPVFKDYIHNIVRSHTSKESRKFSEEDVDRFGDYIISEMPEFLTRVPMGGVVVDAYVYPHDNEVTKFAEDLQKGAIFPEIKNIIMDTEPKVFLEVR